MSSHGNFDFHINKVITKIRQRMGWIGRAFKTNDIVFRKFMWQNYIGGLLDYNSQLWSPVSSVKISSLEQLLITYTFNTKGLENDNYWERLRKMGLSSVQRRFQRYKIIYIWKIVRGLTHNFGLTWTEHVHWGLMIDINKPHFTELNAGSVAAWRQSLAVDGGMLFNHMSSNIRNYEGTSLSGFKMTLDQLLETIPDRPLAQGLYPDPINNVTGLNSNCLIDWSKHLKLCNRLSVDLVLI